MAQQNLLKLASQGRAYDAGRPWSEAELKSLLTLETERGLARTVAADYVRNGILTVEDFDKATEAGFKPKSLDDLRTEAIDAHMKGVRKDLGLADPADVAPEAPVVEEKKEVVEPEVEESSAALETEEVTETAEVLEEVVEEVPVAKVEAKKGGKKATSTK